MVKVLFYMDIDAMNFLFICSKNQWRSPTAEAVYRRGSRINVRSAGTSTKAKRSVSLKDIAWADMIFVMEKKHKQILSRQFPHDIGQTEVIILDIPDEYQFMDGELVELLKDGVERYI